MAEDRFDIRIVKPQKPTSLLAAAKTWLKSRPRCIQDCKAQNTLKPNHLMHTGIKHMDRTGSYKK